MDSFDIVKAWGWDFFYSKYVKLNIDRWEFWLISTQELSNGIYTHIWLQ